jgi:ABC-type sugar transport system ATPase subunit
LHDVCRKIRARGGCVVYVSHRLDEIFDLSDRVVVMRDGRVTEQADTADLTHASLVDSITGGGVAAARERGRGAVSASPDRDAPPLLAVVGLEREGVVGPVSFDLAPGEILGIAGLVGSGRTELLRLLYGADRRTGGTVEAGGREVPLRRPSEAMRAGIALLPEDRRHEGLIMSFGVRENTTLASLARMGSRFPGFPSRARERQVTDELIERLDVVTPGGEQPVRLLSGGNQQKVVIAKWLARDSNVLLFDEPTAGIDIGAKAQIYGIVEELARQGKGAILVSSEFTELVSVCHRVIVMREGAQVGTLVGDEISEGAIVALCYGAGATGPGDTPAPQTAQ